MTDRLAPAWHDFASRDALASDLAATIVDRLRKAIDARGGATLAVSGGTTPGLLFDTLSGANLDWSKVAVTLVDERLVEPTSERSNERLVRERLLRGEARLARFVPLAPRNLPVDPAEAAKAAEAGVALLGQRLDVVILGMGADGHTASFFPDAADLDAMLDLAQPHLVLPVIAQSAGEPRLTLTLPLIASARFLALHIEGDAKRSVFEKAMSSDTAALPIRRVLDATASRPHIYWTA